MGNEQLGEGSQGLKRPMKKAKYPWQIKGKSRTEMTDSTSRNNSVISASADSIATPSNSSTRSCPRYFPSATPTKRPADSPCNADPNCSRHQECITERMDRGLARWQAKQIARGFVDNKINRLLDSWLVAPLEESDSSVGVEDAAILMAISEHGLQNGSPSFEVSQSPQSSYESILNDLTLPGSSGRSNFEFFQQPPLFQEVPLLHQATDPDHFDFLDAAVAVAIRRKGLTALTALLPPSGQS